MHDLITRFLPPIAIALAITALLFLLMKGLINNEQPRLDERPTGAHLTFVPLIEDRPVVEIDHQKPEKTVVEPPPTNYPTSSEPTVVMSISRSHRRLYRQKPSVK